MLIRLTLSLSLSFFAILGTKAKALPTKRNVRACNGHAELCSRSYGNVTFMGAHDSFAFSNNPLQLAADQSVDIPTQLGLGARLLQAQSHMNNGVLHFCHTTCSVLTMTTQALFDGGTVASYLAIVKTFLDANPNEVLTLLFTNPEGADVKSVWDPIFKGAGIDQLAFISPSVPVPQSAWPTLGSMIDSGKRVVVFLDAGADTSRVPYILPEFDMIWETPFDSTNSKFPCSVDRIRGPLAQTEHMALINHFLDSDVFGIDVPNKGAAGTTNGVPSILADAAGCARLNEGRNPNFVLMDWVNVGSGKAAVDKMNGLV
ncbi:PLC-like phosphodiesterase [Hysterangium stoloniferum]|nr:PLC-like phosphodiesterase [Hysterangium stoloniferum]